MTREETETPEGFITSRPLVSHNDYTNTFPTLIEGQQSVHLALGYYLWEFYKKYIRS